MSKLLCLLARIIFLLTGSVLCNGVASAAAARPNIVLILSDDHSVPHLGCYGSPNPKTPNLDAFAAQGIRFYHAHTTAPQCAPSRGSLFTGRSPIANDSTRFTQPARADHPFFTDVLRQNGYWVGLDGRTHHLSGRRPGEDHENEALAAAGLKYLEQRFDHVRTGGPQNGEAFGEALDKVPRGKSFFLYFGFSQPHRGFPPPPPEHASMFEPAKLQLPPDFPDLPEVRADYARYLYKVYRLDQGFAGIMKVLEQRKLTQNTVVVFMGDNGEALLRGKGTLYQRGTNVPLIVRWPGVVAGGSRSDVLVSGEDLAPTLLEAVGLTAPTSMTGVSFLPVLKGQRFAGREYVYTERGWHFGPVTRTDGLDLSRAIISSRYKFIFNFLPDRPYTPVDMVRDEVWRELVNANKANKLSALHRRLIFPEPRRPLFELFDLQDDPHEMTNLAGQKGMEAIERKLRLELARWMVREGDYLPLPSLKYPEHHEFNIFHDKP